MANAQEVARFIVRSFQEAGEPVTNLKLQKLLYYVQGWHLALRNEAAFPDRIEAWVHGPVQPGVYGAYKTYRWMGITGDVADTSLAEETVEVIKSVLETYGGEGGYQLELRTHLEQPWLEARGDFPPDRDSNKVITTESMFKFFSGLAADGTTQ